ncbi:MAG: phosphopantetheine-binding protein [Treponema sp.]|jgi:acyl carrier protein|nr:phosphopantetheine-binding protein [Treponema sp.]
MTKEELFAKIQETLVEKFEIEAERVRPEALLYEELELDSIDAVDLIVEMKPYIPGKIEPDLFKQTKTVQDVVEALFPLLES